MRQCKVLSLCVVAVAAIMALSCACWAVGLPFADSFENVPVGTYPAVNGWIILLSGKSGYVSNAAASAGSRSFRLDSWPWSAHADYVRLDQVPDCIGYQASVSVDAVRGKTAAVGFVKRFGSGPMSNYFLIDGRARRVKFYGTAWVDLGPYTPGTWCNVRADLDHQALKADLWVNGVVVAEQVDIAPKLVYSPSLGFVPVNQWGVDAPSPSYSDPYQGNVVYFDDLKLWEWVKVIPVNVDIKPGTYPNTINLRSRGVLPLAIFSGEDFDATEINPSTVRVAGAMVAFRGQGKCLAHQEDVDGDGLMDLLIQVETTQLDRSQLLEGYAVVTGETCDGRQFQGQDDVLVLK